MASAATTLMLKALFGAVENIDPTFSTSAMRAALEEQVAQLPPSDAHGRSAAIRKGALDAIAEALST
ncbi:MAG: hypothetical protein C3F11_08390 [Methylocystaceae bacterium]|nr:MAG: hypothetical protein C3F11_08390 [Methylocystaceae bacterium]